MAMKIKVREAGVKFKVWYKWFGQKGYEYVYADGPYEAEQKFLDKERYKDHPKELLRVETPGTVVKRKSEASEPSAYAMWKSRRDYIVKSLKKAASAFENLEMEDRKDWGEAGNLGSLKDRLDTFMQDARTMGYIK